MDAPEQYLHELRDELSLYATWLPTDPMELGAFGVLKKGRFQVEGRLADLGIAMQTRAHDRKHGFQKSRGIRIEVQSATAANASVIDASIGATLAFDRAFAWAFSASGVRSVEIYNIADIGKAVLAAKQMNAWQSEWLLVTEIREVSLLNVFVARAKNVRARIHGKGEVSAAEVLLAEELAVDYRAEDLFVVQGERDTTPLYGVRKLGGVFGRRLRAGAGEDLPLALEESYEL